MCFGILTLRPPHISNLVNQTVPALTSKNRNDYCWCWQKGIFGFSEDKNDFNYTKNYVLSWTCCHLTFFKQFNWLLFSRGYILGQKRFWTIVVVGSRKVCGRVNFKVIFLMIAVRPLYVLKTLSLYTRGQPVLHTEISQQYRDLLVLQFCVCICIPTSDSRRGRDCSCASDFGLQPLPTPWYSEVKN